MARNGSGTYNLLTNSWNPATNGVSATAVDWQNLINDVAAALTQSLSADGQTPMTGNLNAGNNKITGLAAGTGAGQSIRWEQVFTAPASFGGGAVNVDAAGNVGIGTSSPAFRLDVGGASGTIAKFAGTGGQFQGVRIQNNHGSASQAADVFLDAANESGVVVANMLASIQTDGGSAWSWSTQPPGARTGRRVERARITSDGLFQFNSGYGSVATAYACRAWVNFDGTGTVAIRASGNVSSITDNGTGDYTVNFTTALVDVNYSVTGTAVVNTSSTPRSLSIGGASPATTACRVITGIPNVSYDDCQFVCVAIFR